MPSNFFMIIDAQLKISTNTNIELLQEESKLKMQYRNLNKKKILFDNEEKTISSISGLFSQNDRNIRKKVHDTVNDFYYENSSEYQKILFELINTRNKIAKNLGFNNYLEYSLLKLKRFGYNSNM